ncbi:MAG TPA: GntR family transcriptional regulator [Clostridia bacterium]|nr:GntR family transcriptional regulator [Clostridia bacterium]
MLNPDFVPAKSLYLQIKDKIKEQILSGEWKQGSKIPSERELCKTFGVSRITVRQAIAEAVNEGLLFTVQGKGTFVAGTGKEGQEHKISQELAKITNFERTLSSKGLSASTRIVKYEITSVDLALSRILELDMSSQVLHLDLLGLANNEPYVLYRSSFALDTGIRFLEKAKEKEKAKTGFSTVDLYQYFEDIKPYYVEQTFEALAADDYLAEILAVDVGTPLFLASSIVYDVDSRPIEYKNAYYRGDKYKFHIKRYF